MSGEEDGAPRAMRLIFEYDGDDVRLVSQQPVDMTVVSAPPGEVERAGHYVETRDEAGKRLARIPIRGGFTQSNEVFPESHDEPITRVDSEAHGAFTVVVPAHEAAAQIAVLRVAPPQRRVRAKKAKGQVGPVLALPQEVDLATFALEQRKQRP